MSDKHYSNDSDEANTTAPQHPNGGQLFTSGFGTANEGNTMLLLWQKPFAQATSNYASGDGGGPAMSTSDDYISDVNPNDSDEAEPFERPNNLLLFGAGVMGSSPSTDFNISGREPAQAPGSNLQINPASPVPAPPPHGSIPAEDEPPGFGDQEPWEVMDHLQSRSRYYLQAVGNFEESRWDRQEPTELSPNLVLNDPIGYCSSHVPQPRNVHEPASGQFLDIQPARAAQSNTSEIHDGGHRSPGAVTASAYLDTLGMSRSPYDEPWSRLNTRAGHQALHPQTAQFEPSQIHDMREHSASQDWSYTSSDLTHFTAGTASSSGGLAANELSASTATLKPTNQPSFRLSGGFRHHSEMLAAYHNFDEGPARSRGFENPSSFVDRIVNPNQPDSTSSSLGAHPATPRDDGYLLQVPLRHDPSSPSPSSVSGTSSSALACSDCGVEFTGDYRKGNLARHRRQKHGRVEQVYACEERGCGKDFKRQDARLKHYRRRHTWLAPDPPLLRKQ